MEIREITEDTYREKWNKLAGHPMQAWEWGEFRRLTGVKAVRYGLFQGDELKEVMQITIHPIPHTKWTVGYFPKGNALTTEMIKALKSIAAENNCIFIKCEPMAEVDLQRTANGKRQLQEQGFEIGRSLFTKYNFVLDVTRSEEELRAALKQKTRYNIKVAEKRGVVVEIDNSEEAFKRYLELTEETTGRQGFYAHSADYHRKMWQQLNPAGIANLLTAKLNGEIITTWVLFRFNDTLYYPYGASTREHREVMANNLVMWKAIQLAKEWDLQYLDMWGALGPDPDRNDPWYGFHTFKAGYGPRHVEYIGTFDYIASPLIYRLYRTAETWRWRFLRLLKRGS